MSIKRYSLLVVCLVTVLLSACAQSKIDTQPDPGIIGEGRTVGYEYAVMKTDQTFSWEIGRNGETTVIIEEPGNQAALQSFMTAVDDHQAIFIKLLSALLFLLLVSVLVFSLYKNNRKLLKDGASAIILAGAIALYIAADASIDLTGSLQDMKILYARLTS